ncbi:hypothetical protein RJ55_08628 [Drechmeria coniospora]|nr:hypothetical protein RJ55_08628 [Drechmeria coniospora]
MSLTGPSESALTKTYTGVKPDQEGTTTILPSPGCGTSTILPPNTCIKSCVTSVIITVADSDGNQASGIVSSTVTGPTQYWSAGKRNSFFDGNRTDGRNVYHSPTRYLYQGMRY